MLASLDDIIRTTAAAGGKKAEASLPRLHRLLDLAQAIGPTLRSFHSATRDTGRARYRGLQPRQAKDPWLAAELAKDKALYLVS
jgi:hypothetical protein